MFAIRSDLVYDLFKYVLAAGKLSLFWIYDFYTNRPLN